MSDETGAIRLGDDGIAVVNDRRVINSRWAGRKYADTPWTPELARKYPDGVWFTRKGFPDFSPYARETLSGLPLTMGRDKGFRLANTAMGWKETPEGWTWHQVEDMKTLQLIPTDLHRAIRHVGGVAVRK